MIQNVHVNLKILKFNMSKRYKGNLKLEWEYSQKSIFLQDGKLKKESDTEAPKINWVNKDNALFYEISEDEGKGLKPYWVDRNDIRVKEARPLILQKVYVAIEKDKIGTIPGTQKQYIIKETNEENLLIDNLLIKGDNLLALNTLKKIFNNKSEEEKIKCIYIDPPYNTGAAFEHYDDNLAHSEWLTLMRDRLIALYQLLRNDGVLIVHLDDEEVFYCKLLLDEIFGRSNFLNSISIKSSTPSGVKTAHKEKTIIKQKDIVLVYRKTDQLKIKPVFIKRDSWDGHYSLFLEEINSLKKEYKLHNLIDILLKYKIISDKISVKELDINNKKFKEFYLKYSKNICRLQSHKNKKAEQLSRKKENQNKVVSLPNKDGDAHSLYYNGQVITPLIQSIKKVLNNRTISNDLGMLLCDFWWDIDFQNTQNEGSVSFPTSKKPEMLMYRFFEMFTSENDLILDCFAGSGSSLAVAQKMKRKWIGVEVGNHAKTHIVSRLQNILKGVDDSGVSITTNWQGGGSFKYYHLGHSIIDHKLDGTIDFNWTLGKKFIEESFLSSYDYILIQEKNLFDNKLFEKSENKPTIGIQKIASRSKIAVVLLNEPKGKLGMITYDEVMNLYKIIKEKYSPEYINIFTNRGIDIASDSKPVDLEVIKIPNAIFTELENL